MMRSLQTPVFLFFACVVFLIAPAPGSVMAERDEEKIMLVDECDPAADWGLNQCLREEGSVTRVEFNLFSSNTTGSPLVSAVIGHPAWRMDPGYLLLPLGEDLKIINTGGRGHTFTSVDDFGGGNVGSLNTGLTVAPECAGAQIVAPGGRTDVTGLSAGLHKFQCCIHPWMRALVKVE
jgi:plastocyanin